MKHRKGGIANELIQNIRRYNTDSQVTIVKDKAVEVIQWGHDCKRYEFADGTRLIHNELANGWDV